jgi:hypothetical protein
MPSVTEIAKKFFEACETGKGWEGCKAYCKTDATFSAQAEPLAGVKNLQQYTATPLQRTLGHVHGGYSSHRVRRKSR